MKTIQNYFHSHSLRFHIYLLLLLLIFLFGTLVAYNNFSAFSLLRKNVYRNTEDTLILYQKHLEDTLDRTETCLYTLAINNSALFTLKNTPQNTTEWFRALSQLQFDLRNAMSIYTANGFFCYLSAKEQLITQNFLADSLSLRQVIRQTVTQEAPNLSSWTVVETEGIYYLFRILYIDNAYMGAWVSLDTLLNSLTGDEDRARLVFSGEDGSLYCGGQPAPLRRPNSRKNPLMRGSLSTARKCLPCPGDWKTGTAASPSSYPIPTLPMPIPPCARCL